MVKAYLKARLQACERCYRVYTGLKYQLKTWSRLRYFLHDLAVARHYMVWRPFGAPGYEQLCSELLFYYHKIEKGLCMPGPRRLFGVEPAVRIIELLKLWQRCGFDPDDPIYRGAVDSLAAYRNRIEDGKLDPARRILPAVATFLASATGTEPEETLPTPLRISAARIAAAGCHATLRELYQVRRSYRNFAPRAVDSGIVRDAVAMAQLSPSACNRQPCRVYVVDDAVLKQELLSFQNGNAGFGHLVPHVAVITADSRCFFDASERNEPYVDGGLFSMSLIYALLAQGIVSCCLNWCVPVATDREFHRRFGIHASELIIMLLAFGYPLDENVVPQSPRKAEGRVLLELTAELRAPGRPSRDGPFRPVTGGSLTNS